MEHKKDGFINQRAIVLPQAIKEILIHNELTSLLYVTDIGTILMLLVTIARVTKVLNRIF